MAHDFHMLADRVDEMIGASAGDFEAFLQCQSAFQKILSSRLYVGQLHQLLKFALSDEPMLTYGPYVVLHLGRHCSWTVVQHPARMPGTSLVPNHSLEAPISDAPLAMRRLSLPEGFDIEAIAPGTHLIDHGQQEVASGAIVARNGRSEAIALAGTAGPSLTLRLTSSFFGEYEWSIDPQSRAIGEPFSTRERESYVVTIFDLLAAAGSPNSLDVLDRFSRHPLHYVRWKAIQAIAEIDGDEGARLATLALTDPHPDIREAAAAATKLLERAEV